MPHTLLLADDSVTIQRVIELTFADEDIKVVAVSDGDQAIERLDAAPPDIVLADIGMPGKNGYEVAQYVRQSPKLSHIPVVLLTGAFEPVDQARAAQAGCDGVLAKPFEPQLVIGRVKDLLAKGRNTPGSADAVVAPASIAPVPAPGAAPAASGPPLDDYFDKLDAAFSTLNSAPAQAAPQDEPTLAPASDPGAAPIGTPEIDWFSTAPAPGAPAEPWDLPAPVADTSASDLPLTLAPPPAASEVSRPDAETVVPPSAPAQEPAAPSAAVPPGAVPPATVAPAVFDTAADHAQPAPLPAVPASAMPSLGDAFAALLAAEHGGDSAAEWPATTAPPPAPVVTDAMIEDVVRRVLDRMSDSVVRETTADVVSKIAERLVREEIDRIKASLR